MFMPAPYDDYKVILLMHRSIIEPLSRILDEF